MRLRDRRSFTKPEVMIIPMIDIMFFLLVFFMLSTLYMVNLKTVGDVNIPKATGTQTQMHVTYLVSVKKDGTLYLEDKAIEEHALIANAKAESARNPKFAIVVRADEGIDYGKVVSLLGKFREAGITRFALAAESGGQP